MTGDLQHLTERLRTFSHERGWEQFHTPRNLLLALVGEVGELAELAQWRTDEEIAHELADGQLHARVADEAADVLLYLTRLTDVCGIDLVQAGHDKLDRNHTRFPIADRSSTASRDPQHRED